LNDPLLLSQTVDFAAIARSLEGHLRLGTSAKGGRPAWPTQVMVQQLYNLSDDALEYQLLDRHSLVHFAGLEHSSRVPAGRPSPAGVETAIKRFSTQFQLV